jgi:hypothetical protein
MKFARPFGVLVYLLEDAFDSFLFVLKRRGLVGVLVVFDLLYWLA